jgi:PAS domain S-box-containing protein
MNHNKDQRPLDFSAFPQESAEDLYDNAPCGYVSVIPDGTIVRINHTLLNWLDYRHEELLMVKKLSDLFTVGGRIFYETLHLPLLRIQGFVSEINYDLVRKNGSLLPVLANATMVKDEHGKLLLIRTTFFNITDRKKYEVELLQAKKKAEQAARAKDGLLSTVSHEIRTPMHAIVGVTRMLFEQNPAPHQVEYLRILKFSSQNLLNLINDILDFSRIESGKVSLEEKSFPIKQLLEGLLAGIIMRAEEKGIAVDVQLDEQLPDWLLGDALKIGQVITNLMGNALKFTKKGRISLQVKVQELNQAFASLDFAVLDTGIGISADKLVLIFEEFVQASDQINFQYGGTGLGLSISQKLLAMMGSKMVVESQLGQGSKFSFQLVLQRSEPPVQPVEVKESKWPSLKGIKLLLAEDNNFNIMLMTQCLAKWEVEYEVVKNGRLAVEKTALHAYDIVLMDLQLPDLNGFDASRIIRARPGKYLPIVALSASYKQEVFERLASAGIDDFVSKPFDPTDLYNKITTYTRRNTV